MSIHRITWQDINAFELKPPTYDFEAGLMQPHGPGEWVCVAITAHGNKLIVAWRWQAEGV